jgi:enoyl-CoA hydratase
VQISRIKFERRQPIDDFEPMTDSVLISDFGSVRLITMNRPHARNALGAELILSLYAALVDSDDDADVHAIVLTGADPSFCAGIDLKEAARDGEGYFRWHRKHPCIEQVARMRTPIIGAINGPTFTGGLEMALGCDFLIASERAAFADTHASVGIIPGGGMTARLPNLVGQARARRMSFTGEVVSAEEALRIGLVTEVVEHTRLIPRALELAVTVSDAPTEIIGSIKQIYVEGNVAALQEALTIEKTASHAKRPEGKLLDERRRAVSDRNKRQISALSESEETE